MADMKSGIEHLPDGSPLGQRACAYGLTIGSTHPIPGLLPLPAEAPPAPVDVTVHWGAAHPGGAPGVTARTPPSWERLHASDVLDDQGRPLFTLDRAVAPTPAANAAPDPATAHASPELLLRLAYADATTFWIRIEGSPSGHPTGHTGPTQIWAYWPPELTSEDASTYFLGPVLGYLLRIRGQTVLHASAVGLAPMGEPSPGASISPGAVAFVGPPGAGKSTTSAAFALRGHPLLTEDACALEEPGADAAPDAPFRVLPGYPLVRLWPHSVEILYGRPDALPLLTPTWDKRYLPLGGTGVFATEPLPLRAIFLLEEREDADDAPRVLPIAPAEAFMQMVANTYRNLVLSPDERVREFQTLHRLLRTTPVYRIIPHADPARLDDLLDLILQTATPDTP